MNQDQRALIAVVFDMNKVQLRAALYQIIQGDDVGAVLTRPRVRPKRDEKTSQPELRLYGDPLL